MIKISYSEMIRYAIAKGFGYTDEDTIDTLIDGVMATLKSRARTDKQKVMLDNFYNNLDVGKRNEFNRLTGKITGFELVVKRRRAEAEMITWENIKPMRFARSIKKGVVTKSFQEFYKLSPSEASEVVFRLQAQAIESGDVKV